MKNKSIFWVLFFVVLAIILFSSSIFKTNEVKLSTLSIETINTEIIVKDEIGNILLNNSQIEVGEDYTITFIESADYVLETFKINNVDYVNNIENNQYTFTCTGSTTIYVSSTEKQGGDILPDLPPVDETKYSVSYISLNRGAVFNSINAEIDLVVYDSNNNFFTRLTPGDYFYAPENSNFNIKFDIKTPSCVVSGLTYALSTGLFASHYAFPIVIENISQDMNIYVHYYSARIDTSYSVEAGIPVQVQTLGGDITNNFVVGEQYTIVDTCNPGYEAVVNINNEQVTLPHTFTYTEDAEFDITAEKIKVVPDMQIYMAGYTLNDTLGNPVTELVYGETYTLNIVPDYCCEFTELQFNGISVYENPYTFTFTDTYASFYCFCNYSNLPYSVSADNCSYYFTDVAGNMGITDLVLNNQYTLYVNPVDGYSITSATLNGMEISLPYTFTSNNIGETFDFVIYTQEETVNNTVSIFLSYDDIAGSAYITDIAGNQVSEYAQNTDYIVVASPYYGYSLDNITFNSGEELSNGSFNTGNETDITICVNFSVLTVAVVDIVEATNCSYTFTASWGSVVSELIYNRGYTLTAIADNGYSISSVEYMGETHALPYTFTFNNLTEKFLLNAIQELSVLTISLNYDSSMCSACITDTDGNVVSEYAQNTDYIIVVNPFNGYEVSSIIWQPGIELTNNSVFNTGPNEYIPIFVTCEEVDIIISYSAEFYFDNSLDVDLLVYDNSNNLLAQLDNGESFVCVRGSDYSLKYLNNSNETFSAFSTINGVKEDNSLNLVVGINDFMNIENIDNSYSIFCADYSVKPMPPAEM